MLFDREDDRQQQQQQDDTWSSWSDGGLLDVFGQQPPPPGRQAATGAAPLLGAEDGAVLPKYNQEEMVAAALSATAYERRRDETPSSDALLFLSRKDRNEHAGAGTSGGAVAAVPPTGGMPPTRHLSLASNAKKYVCADGPEAEVYPAGLRNDENAGGGSDFANEEEDNHTENARADESYPELDDPSKRSKKKPKPSRSGEQGGGNDEKKKPPRPLSAYNLFFRDYRIHLMKQRNGSVPFSDMGKEVGKKWRSLRLRDRRVWEDMAKKESRLYQQRLEAAMKRELEKKQRRRDEFAAAVANAVTGSTTTTVSTSSEYPSDSGGCSTSRGGDPENDKKNRAQQELLWGGFLPWLSFYPPPSSTTRRGRGQSVDAVRGVVEGDWQEGKIMFSFRPHPFPILPEKAARFYSMLRNGTATSLPALDGVREIQECQLPENFFALGLPPSGSEIPWLDPVDEQIKPHIIHWRIFAMPLYRSDAFIDHIAKQAAAEAAGSAYPAYAGAYYEEEETSHQFHVRWEEDVHWEEELLPPPSAYRYGRFPLCDKPESVEKQNDAFIAAAAANQGFGSSIGDCTSYAKNVPDLSPCCSFTL